ncbi:hypothetical protein RBB50_012288 [Rhinocladiella similis]
MPPQGESAGYELEDATFFAGVTQHKMDVQVLTASTSKRKRIRSTEVVTTQIPPEISRGLWTYYRRAGGLIRFDILWRTPQG